jgi:hypothetical protein
MIVCECSVPRRLYQRRAMPTSFQNARVVTAVDERVDDTLLLKDALPVGATVMSEQCRWRTVCARPKTIVALLLSLFATVHRHLSVRWLHIGALLLAGVSRRSAASIVRKVCRAGRRIADACTACCECVARRSTCAAASVALEADRRRHCHVSCHVSLCGRSDAFCVASGSARHCTAAETNLHSLVDHPTSCRAK